MRFLQKHRNINPSLRRGLKQTLFGVSLLALTFVFLTPILSEKPVYVGKSIKSIRFLGLKNVDPIDLYPLLSMQPGQKLVRTSLNEDVKALFESGYFKSVILRMQILEDDTLAVYFDVIEFPRVEEVLFLGVDELYPSDLKKSIKVREGEVYNLQKVKQGIKALKRKYREEGFFHAEVWYRIGELDTETNSVIVTYIVDEGENIPIAKINIIGVKNLDPEEIAEFLEHKEEGIIEDGVFRESIFEQDKFKILAYAKTRGYLDAVVDPEGTGYEIRWRNPSEPSEGRVVVITYKISEGNIRYFGGYSVKHDTNRRFINQELNPPERKIKGPEDLVPVYNPDVIEGALEYSDGNMGDVFDEGKFVRDRQLIQELYSRQGYVFAQVAIKSINVPLNNEVLTKYENCLRVAKPGNATAKKCKEEAEVLDLQGLRTYLTENPDKKDKVLRHIHFFIRENGLAYIENIIVKGMVKTQEHVIRREILVKEGQLFNSALVNRSREKIANLGFFKEVNLKTAVGSDGTKMNLIIDVEEQPTGTISMGGGYGTNSGFSIFTELGENNLNGTGRRIKGRLEYGPQRRQVSLSWTDPWIYEACQSSTGSFWKNKQKGFDEAPNLETIYAIAETLQNNYLEYGKLIKQYAELAGDSKAIEDLDAVKVKIRKLLEKFVAEEEDCYRSIPRPWSLNLETFWVSREIQATAVVVSADSNDVAAEESTYEKNQLGFLFGTSHTFLLNWAHYHSYSPSWSTSSKPTALVSDNILREVNLGWQFRSSLRNGIIYDTRDSVFNTTTGSSIDLSIETVGQLLGGQDHFNRYRFSAKKYFWWFDYTLGGLIRKSVLKRWRVVQEFRFSGSFTHETAPWSGRPFGRDRSLLERLNPFSIPKQDKEINPFIEPEERLFIGGYESLRGYSYQQDGNFPTPWWLFGGGSHRLLASTELRFPIEPTILWFVLFLDSGSMYVNLGELTGDEKEYVDNYEERNNAVLAQSADPLIQALANRYNLLNFQPYFYDSFLEWNNPKRAVLSQRNVALDRTLFSWGFGLRIQIPVLPLRLFLSQKLYYSGGKFRPIPGDDKFEFVFGIGDVRF